MSFPFDKIHLNVVLLQNFILTISSYFIHIMCTVPFTYQDPVEY